MLNSLGLLLAVALSGSAPAATPCPSKPQPMPRAIEAVDEPSPASSIITFAATPWQSSGRAWVIRVSQAGGTNRLEIFRLMRRNDCNVWDIDGRWQAPVRPEEHRSLTDSVRPWAMPPKGFPTVEGMSGGALDGTALELRVKTSAGWEVTRTLNHYGADGEKLSVIFQALIRGHVPDIELPSSDWRAATPVDQRGL